MWINSSKIFIWLYDHIDNNISMRSFNNSKNADQTRKHLYLVIYFIAYSFPYIHLRNSLLYNKWLNGITLWFCFSFSCYSFFFFYYFFFISHSLKAVFLQKKLLTFHRFTRISCFFLLSLSFSVYDILYLNANGIYVQCEATFFEKHLLSQKMRKLRAKKMDNVHSVRPFRIHLML